MPTRVWIAMGPEWRLTEAALRDIETELPHWLRENLKDAIDPLVEQARREVMRVGVFGGPHTGHTGLRARVAAGVGVRYGVGRSPYARVYTSMADPSEAPIPRGFDKASGWRHPLFGDKRHWYRSTPTRTGWFSDTIAGGRREIERALEDALERAARRVDAAS